MDLSSSVKVTVNLLNAKLLLDQHGAASFINVLQPPKVFKFLEYTHLLHDFTHIISRLKLNMN